MMKIILLFDSSWPMTYDMMPEVWARIVMNGQSKKNSSQRSVLTAYALGIFLRYGQRNRLGKAWSHLMRDEFWRKFCSSGTHMHILAPKTMKHPIGKQHLHRNHWALTFHATVISIRLQAKEYYNPQLPAVAPPNCRHWPRRMVVLSLGYRLWSKTKCCCCCCFIVGSSSFYCCFQHFPYSMVKPRSGT